MVNIPQIFVPRLVAPATEDGKPSRWKIVDIRTDRPISDNLYSKHIVWVIARNMNIDEAAKTK